LDAGTLLGAIRHKGMIPWDSDIDIAMVRDDCYKLIPILKDKFKNSQYIVRETTGRRNLQIRICKQDNFECGIDIFPFDKYYSPSVDELTKKKISKTMRKIYVFLRYLPYLLPQVTKDLNKMRNLIKFLTQKFILNNKQCTIENPALIFGLDFSFNIPGNLILDYDTIFPLKTIEFEDETFSCPNNIHAYLVNYYGKNYLQYPPRFKENDDKIDEYLYSLLENKIENERNFTNV
jgi:lipopolysaccharide cholinephosphotransferase